MTRQDVTPLELHQLDDLLDCYGADAERWPAGKRAAAEALLATSAQARRALADAAALDRLLAKAPAVQRSADAALVDRIVAAAMSEPREHASETGDGVVVPFKPRTGVVLPQAAVARRAGSSPSRVERGLPWRAAAALAASLLCGVLVGTFDLAPQPVRNLMEMANAETGVSQLLASLGNDSLTTVLDEEQL
ncbi:MAG: hypothetical protein R3D68_12510 [Hyphomicrobiaceae bacterium]